MVDTGALDWALPLGEQVTFPVGMEEGDPIDLSLRLCSVMQDAKHCQQPAHALIRSGLRSVEYW